MRVEEHTRRSETYIMAEVAISTVRSSHRASGPGAWLRPLAFWGMVAAGVGAALYAGASSRDAAWARVQTQQAAQTAAVEARTHEQALAQVRAAQADAAGELARDKIRLAAMADATMHLRLDLAAGTLALVQDGYPLRAAPLVEGHSFTAPESVALTAAQVAALPVAEADQSALEGVVSEGMVLHVY